MKILFHYVGVPPSNLILQSITFPQNFSHAQQKKKQGKKSK